jgi:hypothetical protein
VVFCGATLVRAENLSGLWDEWIFCNSSGREGCSWFAAPACITPVGKLPHNRVLISATDRNAATKGSGSARQQALASLLREDESR